VGYFHQRKYVRGAIIQMDQNNPVLRMAAAAALLSRPCCIGVPELPDEYFCLPL
jgi:hypothetical protein